MKIIEPKVELFSQENPVDLIAKCARICYGNEDKHTDDHIANIRLYESLIKRNHISMLRHGSGYYIIDIDEVKEKIIVPLLDYFNYGRNPYVEIRREGNLLYVATNENFILDNKDLFHELQLFRVPSEEFNFTKIGHSLMRYTFCITTQLSTARELNRKSPNNIAERSTRYIQEGKKDDYSIVRPHWLKGEYDITNNSISNINSPILANEILYITACKDAFDKYNNLLKIGMKPEDARGVLPLDTMTKVIYTYSVKEWKHILDLRLFDKTGTAHPNCKIVMELVKEKLESLGYNFNNNK